MKLNQIVRYPFLLLLLATIALIGATVFEGWRRADEGRRREQEYREFQKRLGDAPLLELDFRK